MNYKYNLNYNFNLLYNYDIKNYLLYILLKLFKIRNNRFETIRKEVRWYKKIYKLKKEFFPGIPFSLSQTQKKKINDYFSSFKLKESYDWHALYFHLNGSFNEKYISEYLFYTKIEPALNQRNANYIYNNKNFYDKLYPKEFNPKSYLRCINYKLTDSNYEPINGSTLSKSIFLSGGEYIIKPTVNTSKGLNIYKFTFQNNKFIINNFEYTLSEIVNKYQGNFIVQEIVQQNNFLKSIHSSSLNTLRIITLRFKGNYHVLSSIAKFGINNNLVDNVGIGGIFFGVNSDGNFLVPGYDNSLNKIYSHPNTQIKLSGKAFPYYDLLSKTSLYLHKHVFHYDIISWDMALDINNNPVFIENNPFLQALNGHQIVNGPLFGDLTDQVLESIFNKL